MNGITSTSIPVKGDRSFVQTMKALAAQKGTSVAALVRQALDQTYGDELAPFLKLFVASNDASIPHTRDESIIEEPAHAG